MSTAGYNKLLGRVIGIEVFLGTIYGLNRRQRLDRGETQSLPRWIVNLWLQAYVLVGHISPGKKRWKLNFRISASVAFSPWWATILGLSTVFFVRTLFVALTLFDPDPDQLKLVVPSLWWEPVLRNVMTSMMINLIFQPFAAGCLASLPLKHKS